MNKHFLQTKTMRSSLWFVMALLCVVTCLGYLKTQTLNTQVYYSDSRVVSNAVDHGHDYAHALKKSVVKSSQENTPADFDTLTPLNRAAASAFLAQPQVVPDYVLEIEFFPIGLLSASFLVISNPDKVIRWYEFQQSSKPSARLSLWKDGNQLYTNQVNYAVLVG